MKVSAWFRVSGLCFRVGCLGLKAVGSCFSFGFASMGLEGSSVHTLLQEVSK